MDGENVETAQREGRAEIESSSSRLEHRPLAPHTTLLSLLPYVCDLPSNSSRMLLALRWRPPYENLHLRGERVWKKGETDEGDPNQKVLNGHERGESLEL